MRARPARLAPFLCAVLAFGACSDGGDGDSQPPTTPQTVDPCTRLDTIVVGQSLSGTLTSTDCQVGGGSVDRWFFTVDSTSNLQLDMSSTNFDTYLLVETMSGGWVAENDDWNGYDSRIVHRFPPGRYRVLARGYDPGAAGSYRLSLAEGPDCSNEGELALGTPVTGELTPDDCTHQWGGILDHWGLRLDEPTRVRLDLTSADFDEVVLIMDSDGYILDGADWQHPSGHARLDVDLPAGEWRVGVASGDPTAVGTYELKADLPPPCTPGTAVTLGEALSGTVDGDDCVFEGWLLADSLHLQLEAETDVVLEVKAPEFQPFLFLFSDQTGFVAMDDGWTTPNTAQIRAVLPAGGYAVYIGRDRYAPAGAYSFTADAVVCEPVGSVAVGASVSGELDATDCLRTNGAYREEWEMTLEDETRVQIDLTSADFDSYLVLRTSDGTLVAEDDDGGADRNARLDLTLPAGAYRLEASSWAPGAVGAYGLSVTAPASGAASVLELDAPAVKTLPAPPTLEEALDALRIHLGEERRDVASDLRALGQRKR